jgi:crotonobetainyl-CoA:carnitine CoA-transferase CaiB-like acyl-CoA transferase
VTPGAELSETPPTIRSRAPTIGEHTVEIMNALGYSDAQVSDLRARGLV